MEQFGVCQLCLCLCIAALPRVRLLAPGELRVRCVICGVSPA